MSKYLFLISIFLLLQACAGRQSLSLEGATYLVEGKIAVRNEATSQTANFRWRQAGEGFDIEIWGLLGQGRTRLIGNARDVTVIRGDEVLAAGQPDEVMTYHLGFSLPVAVMSAWLRGQPFGRPREQVIDDEGRITAFNERGWQVEMARFREFEPASGQLQPARIVARRDGQAVTVAIRRFLQ